MSAYYIDLLGPIYWLSKRQTVTAGSSAEAEIYATDECIKFEFKLLSFLESRMFLCLQPIQCIMITWPVSIGPNVLTPRVRESILTNFVIIKHIDGKIN